jgi:hypothetical protein
MIKVGSSQPFQIAKGAKVRKLTVEKVCSGKVGEAGHLLLKNLVSSI